MLSPIKIYQLRFNEHKYNQLKNKKNNKPQKSIVWFPRNCRAFEFLLQKPIICMLQVVFLSGIFSVTKQAIKEDKNKR